MTSHDESGASLRGGALSSELGVPAGLPGRLDVPTAELARHFASGFRADARVVVAMSGGVDSSVAAHLMHGAGHALVGLFMRNGVHVDAAESHKKSCCSVSDARDARMVAAQLGFPFQAVDLKEEFGGIIRYFLAEYAAGRTPNPCAICNRDLKFQRLLDFADELGCEGVATGHYARIDVLDGRVVLRRGIDRTKDQSYQLFSVSEKNLSRARLPLGALEKRQVREFAELVGLRTAKKADSQEICFVPSNDYRRLFEERGLATHPGRIVDTGGKVLGEHAGTEHFTIGQRRGHGIAGAYPLYVVALVPETGTVVLGSQEECCSRRMRVGELNWLGVDVPSSGELRAAVQVRYHHTPVPATIRVHGADGEVEFDQPELAVTPGQGAAFYVGERLIGGGWIRSTELVDAFAARGNGTRA